MRWKRLLRWNYLSIPRTRSLQTYICCLGRILITFHRFKKRVSNIPYEQNLPKRNYHRYHHEDTQGVVFTSIKTSE